MEVVSYNAYGSESHSSAQSPCLVTLDLFDLNESLTQSLTVRCGSSFHTRTHSRTYLFVLCEYLVLTCNWVANRYRAVKLEMITLLDYQSWF